MPYPVASGTHIGVPVATSGAGPHPLHAAGHAVMSDAGPISAHAAGMRGAAAAEALPSISGVSQDGSPGGMIHSGSNSSLAAAVEAACRFNFGTAPPSWSGSGELD